MYFGDSLSWGSTPYVSFEHSTPEMSGIGHGGGSGLVYLGLSTLSIALIIPRVKTTLLQLDRGSPMQPSDRSEFDGELRLRVSNRNRQ